MFAEDLSNAGQEIREQTQSFSAGKLSRSDHFPHRISVDEN
jgi:hypothetical protein